MSKLVTIRQKIEADREQDARREAELNETRAKMDALEAKIDDAIASGQNGTAEKLIAEQGQLRTKIEVMQRVNAHKTAPDAYYNELLEINAEEVAQLQPKADKASEELKKAYKVYLEKIIALMKILYEGATTRFDCGVLAGIGFLFNNPRFDRFTSVIHDQSDLVFTRKETEMLAAMEPKFFEMLDQISTYGQYE